MTPKRIPVPASRPRSAAASCSPCHESETSCLPSPVTRCWPSPRDVTPDRGDMSGPRALSTKPRGGQACRRRSACSAGEQRSLYPNLVTLVEAYPAHSKTFQRPGPARGFPQNLKSQFVGRSLASVLLQKKKKTVMGSPRAELLLWELLLRCTALTSFHGNTQKQAHR